MWRRSTNEGTVAAPSAEPKFEAGPPSFPPPTRAPTQRRFNLLIIGLTILLAAGLLGGLLILDSGRRKPPVAPAADEVKQVTAAYLAYFAALGDELNELTLNAVRPFLTDTGAQQELKILGNVSLTGHRYQFRAEHDPQAVVYGGGDLASVDDIVVRHTTPLDLATGKPIGIEQTDTVHESYVLIKQGKAWLIDSVTAFGAASQPSDLGISYAAAAEGRSVDSSASRSIKQAYDNYWIADSRAFKTLDLSPLTKVEVDPLLSNDAALLDAQRQKGQGYQIKVEHNYRIAQEDGNTWWVYDTFADSSYPFDLKSGHRVGQLPTEVIRESYEFKRMSNEWKLVTSTQFK